MAKSKTKSNGVPAVVIKPTQSGKLDKRPVVRWLEEPEKHDYPAAASYLGLITPQDQIDAIVQALQSEPTSHFKAKDLLRAARLPLLKKSNPHVAADLRKIRNGIPLSPVLLVRGDLRTAVPMQVADGYHRICASYLTDENTLIHARIADLP